VDIILQAGHMLLAIDVKAGARAFPGEARPLVELLETAAIPGLARTAQRLGLIVTRGREVGRLAGNVSAVPVWRLFGPAT
jgi:hypothetical protein